VDISLREAAVVLGQSERQVRYAIKQGRIKATLRAGRWVVDRDSLQRGTEQREHRQRQLDGLRASVEATLGLTEDAATHRRWSVRDLKAFQTAVPLLRGVSGLPTSAGSDAAAAALKRTVQALTRGTHEFYRERKQTAYAEARVACCDAVSELLVAGGQAAEALADRIEAELLPAIGGLLRRSERRR